MRHNIRLIADSCRRDLDGLAREAKALGDRRKWVEDEDGRLRRKVESEASCESSPPLCFQLNTEIFPRLSNTVIQRLQGIHLTVDDLSTKGKDIARSDYEPSLDPLSAPVEKLIHDFPNEFDRYHLDDIVVAVMAPIVRISITPGTFALFLMPCSSVA